MLASFCSCSSKFVFAPDVAQTTHNLIVFIENTLECDIQTSLASLCFLRSSRLLSSIILAFSLGVIPSDREGRRCFTGGVGVPL